MIYKQFSMNRKLYVAFIDYSKCFDTVDKHALFEILELNGITGKMLETIKSIYENVFACVKNKNEFSDYFECPIGLKQGCLLSPRLFTIFISEISKALKMSHQVVFNFYLTLLSFIIYFLQTMLSWSQIQFKVYNKN